jgi:hypothetical protein
MAEETVRTGLIDIEIMALLAGVHSGGGPVAVIIGFVTVVTAGFLFYDMEAVAELKAN